MEPSSIELPSMSAATWTEKSCHSSMITKENVRLYQQLGKTNAGKAAG